MVVAVMQPYFFPYIGYFQLIGAADRFFVCDEVQYIRHGWIARNRIYKNDQDPWWYITVPVARHPHAAAIKEVYCVPGMEWKQRILRQLEVYRGKAPNFKTVQDLVAHCLACSYTNIGLLNTYILQQVADYIGMNKTIEVHTGTALPAGADRNLRPIQICKEAGGTTYLNMAGGRSLYQAQAFASAGLQLRFLEPVLTPYRQQSSHFIPGLSILDVLMNHTPGTVLEMVNTYQTAPADSELV